MLILEVGVVIPLGIDGGPLVRHPMLLKLLALLAELPILVLVRGDQQLLPHGLVEILVDDFRVLLWRDPVRALFFF